MFWMVESAQQGRLTFLFSYGEDADISMRFEFYLLVLQGASQRPRKG
jgi:hypothetical protein